eukprot:gene935-1261_t
MSITLQEFLYDKFAHKRLHSITDNAFEEDCRRMATGGHLPPDNVYPPSLYLAKQAIGAEDWRTYEILPQFFKDPDWVAAYDTSIPTTAAELHDEEHSNDGTFWRGSEAKRLCGLVDLLNKHNGAWELCMDWIRVFDSVTYSVGVLGIRCAKRHNFMRNKSRTYKILAVIPGPSIPTNMRPYLRKTILAFKQLGLQGDGLQVTEATVDAAGNHFKSVFSHRPCLIGVHADAPARQKLSLWLAVASFLACGWCLFKAMLLPSASGKGHSYPTGYDKGVQQPARVAAFFKHILHSKGSNSQTAAAAAGSNAAAFLGVVSAEGLRTMSQRAADVQVTSDFGRLYKCIVKYINSYKMEDWLHFVGSFSPYILLGVLSEDAQELWDHLRAAVLHYCRPPTDESPFTSQAREAAAWNMLQYAKKLERKGFPSYMFTWNLHWAVCRLPRQELARGSTGSDAEWWTERVMQVYKEVVGDRVSHHSEQ